MTDGQSTPEEHRAAAVVTAHQAYTPISVPHIDANTPVCTVIVTVDADHDIVDDLIGHARLGVESLFEECPGFISGALHVSSDGRRLVQYLQWESEAAYTQCRDHPKWDDLPSTRRFMEHVAAGRAHVDARTYAVLTDGAPDTPE